MGGVARKRRQHGGTIMVQFQPIRQSAPTNCPSGSRNGGANGGAMPLQMADFVRNSWAVNSDLQRMSLMRKIGTFCGTLR